MTIRWTERHRSHCGKGIIFKFSGPSLALSRLPTTHVCGPQAPSVLFLANSCGAVASPINAKSTHPGVQQKWFGRSPISCHSTVYDNTASSLACPRPVYRHTMMSCLMQCLATTRPPPYCHVTMYQYRPGQAPQPKEFHNLLLIFCPTQIFCGMRCVIYVHMIAPLRNDGPCGILLRVFFILFIPVCLAAGSILFQVSLSLGTFPRCYFICALDQDLKFSSS